MAWNVLDLGTAPYQETWERQLALVEDVQAGAPDTLIVVEHPHVFTLGRRREAANNVLAPGDVEVIEIERGGDVTYHGPGQLVAYPIVMLREGERDLHRFLRDLEQAAIATCARFGLTADREPGKTGVWCGPSDDPVRRKKLCSIGIACRKWVTFHGLAINVSTDLSYFARINPCGFEASVMSSMAVQLDRPLTVDDVKPVLVEELGRALRRLSRPTEASPVL